VRRIVSSRLVTNYEINDTAPVGRVLANLTKSAAPNNDRLVNYMIWLASEPLLARNPAPGLRWLAENGAATMPLSGILTRKAMRRLCDTGEAAKVDQAAEFLASVVDKDTDLTLAALDGLIEGQRARALPPTTDIKDLFAKLNASEHAPVKDRARRLGALWNDPTAIQLTLQLVNDSTVSITERIQAVQTARAFKSDAAREALLILLAGEPPDRLAVEAIRALGELGGDTVAATLLPHWTRFTTAARSALADMLVSRRPWAVALLAAVEARNIATGELPLSAVRALTESKDDFIRQRAAQTIGRVRPANADKQKLIAQKKQLVLNGEADLRAGHELAKTTCLNCHKLNGEGADVGPDLTGVGRANLDALLANVIDPNQVIGIGYENVMIETKDDRSLSGRLVEDTPTHVKLLSAGPKEEVVAKSDIASLRVSEFSVMPEGLEQMPDADFRNLISYLLNATPPPAK
jgi:putative heme-binding domain-containing protein